MGEKANKELEERMRSLRDNFKKYHPNETPEEWAEKMKNELKKIQRRATRTAAAIQRKEEELLRQERESKEYVDTFARRDPSYRLSRLTSKSVEEIVSSGTPKEVAYLNALTFIGMNEGYTLATREQYNGAFDRLSLEEQKEAQAYFNSLCSLKNYENLFTHSMLDFQKDAAFLARYAVEWREYERQAKELTEMYKNAKSLFFSMAGHYKESKFYKDTASGIYIRQIILKKVRLRDKCSIYFEPKTDSFKVDIGSENDANSLRRKIQMRRAFLTESLRGLREKVEAIYLFIKEKDLPEEAITFALEAYILDLKAEAYLQTLELGKEYFRSTINERVANGDEPTPEDIERAVFADFYELKPTKKGIEKEKEKIASHLNTTFVY